MRNALKNTLCILIFATIIYLLYLVFKPKKNIYKKIKANPNAYVNANLLTNTNAHRFQQNELVLDRLPLVEENPSIIPANEIVQMNYKDCNKEEKELYTEDAPLFTEKHTSIVSLDVNDSTHRRINFY
jgi:hypothetical protein